MLESINKLIITQPSAELRNHTCYSNFITLEEKLPNETINEGKEILAKSVIDDLKEAGEVPIAILFSQKQKPCLYIDVWTEKLK